MAVPKKKTCKQSSRTRRSTYIARTRKKLLNGVNLVKCKETGEFTLNHRVSPNGFYKGIEIIKKKEKKVAQVIQA